MGYVFNPFIGNFDNVGTGGGGTGGVEITHVEYYANLPAANLNSGKYYFVDKDTIWNKLNPLTKTQGGLYRSDGITWLAGVVPELAGVSDGTNVLVDYPVVFSGVTVDNTAKTVTINSQTDNNLTNALKSTYDGYATTKLDKNTAITGATKTKITYDTNGLITAGTDATTADIADSTNKRYVTDANLTVIGNTSGTNTGDETASSIISKITPAGISGDLINSGTNIFVANNSFTCVAGAWTKVTMPVVVLNTGEWNTTTNRLTFTKSCTFLLHIQFNGSTSNLKGVGLYKNGVAHQQYTQTLSSYYFTVFFTAEVGDYYEFTYYSTTADTNANYVIKAYQLF